jgi:hypothetical protein
MTRHLQAISPFLASVGTYYKTRPALPDFHLETLDNEFLPPRTLLP